MASRPRQGNEAGGPAGRPQHPLGRVAFFPNGEPGYDSYGNDRDYERYVRAVDAAERALVCAGFMPRVIVGTSTPPLYEWSSLRLGKMAPARGARTAELVSIALVDTEFSASLKEDYEGAPAVSTLVGLSTRYAL